MVNIIDEEPLAVIKVKFDELPDNVKHNMYLLIGVGITYLILTNVMLLSQLLYFYYSKIKNISDNRHYEPV